MDISATTLAILGLYRGHYQRAFHIREVARYAGISVEAARNQLKWLEQMHVITSSQRGSNKDYVLNFGNIITKYYLVLSETLATIHFLDEYFLIKKVIDELASSIDGIAVLFGSFAKGQARENSDIDLFIISERRIDPQAISTLAELIGREINVKFSTAQQFLDGLKAAAPLEQEVVTDYVVLKGIDAFCDIMWAYYAKA
jgi:predicted nucleotidyltransferase